MAQVVTRNGLLGTYRTAQSRLRRAGGPDGLGGMRLTVVGDNALAGVGGSGLLSPDTFLAETLEGRERNWRYNFNPRAFVQEAATTDGAVSGTYFESLTNSGTATLTSAGTGINGAVLSTTGATSGNTNSWCGVDAFTPITNRIAWCTINLQLADPNVNAYDFWFGFMNKPGTASPPTAPVDGAYFKCLTAAGAITIKGGMSKGSTEALTATLTTIASGVPQSIELGMLFQGQVGADFFYRIPTTAPTFVGSEKWVYGGSLSAAANLPTTTGILRPTFQHITRTANTNAMNLESMCYAFERSAVR